MLRLAWRNLWRNKRRTVIVLISIAFGLVLSAITTALGDGYYGQLTDSAARMGTGNLTIEPSGYRAKPVLNKLIAHSPALRDQIVSMENVDAATMRIISQGMVGSSAASIGVRIMGMDTQSEAGHYALLQNIVEGSVFESTSEPMIMIGSLLAKQLDLKTGKKLVLTTADRRGDVVSALLRVKGVFTTQVDEVDRSLIILPIDYLRQLTSLRDDEATQIAVFLDSPSNTDKLGAKLQDTLQSYGAQAISWQEMMPDLAGIIAIDKIANYFFEIFMFFLIAAGILDAVLMGVMERFKEFGIMQAAGLNPKQVWSLIMLETFWLGVIGLAVGIVLSVPIYWYLHTYGLDMSFIMQEKHVPGGVLFDPFIKARFQIEHVLIVLGSVFALIITAGLYPAFLAARSKPVDAMKVI